jgi:soluble lytic murein transglycosylase
MLIRRRHPKLAKSVAAPSAPKEPPAPPLPKALRDDVEEVRLLARAGLDEFARRALGRLDPALRKAKAWAQLRDLARAAGDYRRLAAVTEGRHDDLLRGIPGAGDAKVWRDAYPAPWSDAVGHAAKAAGVPPSLVTAFIRQESAFDPDVVSNAHAVGLMQLLPKTALRIVGELGRPAAPPPDLFRPEVNVELGAWYVGALSKRFGGQVPLVAAAYNAGPTSVAGWFRGRPTAPTDEFVESIPFKETRRYVRHLLRHFVTYRITRERARADVALEALPLELDLTVRPGVDF